MNKITQIPTPKSTESALWDDYVKKSKTAQKTLNLEDGLIARRAWVRFMEAFVEDGNE